MPDDPQGLTANQLVAYNLTRIRKMLGLSQEEAAARLEPYVGAKWSKSVYSTTERSYHGKRIRQFTADDLLAMSLAFGVPVVYFFLPPPPKDRPAGAVLRSGKADTSWRDLFDVMFDGTHHGATFQRALELPPDERPVPNSPAGVALGQLGLPRASVWDDRPPAYAADDPRFRDAGEQLDGDG